MVGSTACKILGVFYFLTVDSQKSGSKVLSKLMSTIYGSLSTDCGQVPTSPPVSAQHHAGQAVVQALGQRAVIASLQKGVCAVLIQRTGQNKRFHQLACNVFAVARAAAVAAQKKFAALPKAFFQHIAGRTERFFNRRKSGITLAQNRKMIHIQLPHFQRSKTVVFYDYITLTDVSQRDILIITIGKEVF